MMITEERIQQTTAKLADTIAAMHTATEAQILARTTLDYARFGGIAGGHIIGKNAEEREANARVYLSGYYGDLEAAERVVRACKLALDLAQLDMSGLRLEMRLMELRAGIEPDEA